MSEVYVARTAHEKAMQRALLQYTIPANRHLVIEALRAAGREDLIGYGKHCLVRPERPNRAPSGGDSGGAKGASRGAKPARQAKKPPQNAKKPAPKRGGKGR